MHIKPRAHICHAPRTSAIVNKGAGACMSDCKAKVSIRWDGTVQFSRAAITRFRPHDVDYVCFYRVCGGGSGTRPLLGRERRELGLMGPGPFEQDNEDDPLEFFRMIHIKPRVRRLYHAWVHPRTKAIMVGIG